jgi:hypothetical protein
MSRWKGWRGWVTWTTGAIAYHVYMALPYRSPALPESRPDPRFISSPVP